MNLSDTEVAWLAGLLEGEGCFLIERSRSARGRDKVRLALRMTDKDVIERAACLMQREVIEVEVSKNPLHKDTFRVRLNGVAALEVMRLVRPHMGQRRGAKIDEILARTNLSHMPRNKLVGNTT